MSNLFTQYLVSVVMVFSVSRVFVMDAWGEEKAYSCQTYRSKKHEVPIYREPDRRSEVLGKLRRSEEVCGYGETKEFVIVQFEKETAFVRVVDLWPPRIPVRKLPEEQLQEWWELRRSGLVPEDPFLWLRSFDKECNEECSP